MVAAVATVAVVMARVVLEVQEGTGVDLPAWVRVVATAAVEVRRGGEQVKAAGHRAPGVGAKAGQKVEVALVV